MRSLKDLIKVLALTTALNYSNPYSSKLDMAYVPGINEKGELVSTIIKEKGEDISSVSDQTLEELVASIGGTPGEAYDAVQGKYATEKAEQLDKEFIESGKYDKLASWCYENGLGVPEQATSYGASNESDDSIAWTNTRTGTIGVNTYADDNIQKMSELTGLSTGQIEELCMTHEYMHNTQGDLGNNVYLIEADVELKLAKYFYNTAMNSEEKERYLEMADVCLKRYVGMMASYLGIRPEELNEETVDELIEDSGFAEYAKSIQPKDLEDKIVEGDFGGSETEDIEAEDSIEAKEGTSTETEYSEAM